MLPKKIRTNFITNLPLTEMSGGWSGISAQTYEQLQRFYDTRFIGPINPPYPIFKKMISKISRTLGFHGDFTLFTPSRLKKVESLYLKNRDISSQLDFFHGATPWIMCNPPNKFATYIDATFSVYLDIYSQRNTFNLQNINSIIQLEKTWLNKADAIFFGSNWAKSQAILEYGLDELKCHTTWVGGNLPVPDKDIYEKCRKFLFISLDFKNKGGYYCVEAFKQVKMKYPDAELSIIGQKPPNEVLQVPGIQYSGLLRKNIQDEILLFQTLLSSACGIVHPTSMDTMGMVLIEAGYYGCPSIATGQFGIPELIKNKKTGILLDLPISVSQIVKYMDFFCKNSESYFQLRKAARIHTSTFLTWDAFGDRINAAINQIDL